MNATGMYLWPGKTRFGYGAAALAGDEAQALGVSHIFILVDPGVSGLLSPITRALEGVGIAYTYYDQVIGNPDVAHTDAAGAAFRASGADCILGLGGGSALDMAKGVRLLAAAPQDVSCAHYISTRADAYPVPPVSTMPPMLAVPTTAGTGSEVTPWGVVTDHETQQKAGIGGINLIPTVALIDPEMTLGLPPFLTAATGMDALSHLIEAYVSTNRHPALDPLILRGIELIGVHLRTAVYKPNNREARQAVMEAALLGGIAISTNWLGACHSLAHQLSTFADMHHGLACAIMLPPQMAFSTSAAPERYGHIAKALRREAGQPEDAAAYVHQLNVDLGLPTRLSAAGVSETLIPTLAEYAIRDLNWTTNPCPTSQAELEMLYREVY